MSDEEKEWITKHKTLRIGMWIDSPPVMFRGKSGEMEGIVPSYIDLIVSKLGLEPKWVRASSLSYMTELARAGEVDMVAAVVNEPDETRGLLLSVPYLFMPIVVVTPAQFPFIVGLRDMEKRVVAMDLDHIPYQRFTADHPKVISMPVSQPEQGLQAVVSGQADAFVAAQPTVAYLTRQYGITDLRIAAMTEYSYRYSVGIRADWPLLQTLVNRALSSITEDERQEIVDYWTVLREGKWVERPHVWRLLSFGAAIALLLLGAMAYWNRKLSKEIRNSLRAEKQQRRAHEATLQVIESADMVIVGLDYMGCVQLINNAGEATLGYSREEILGRDWFDLVVPKERYPFVWDEFTRLMNEGRKGVSDAFENPVLTKSGETRHIMWRNSIMQGTYNDLALISFGTDITNRLQAEEELQLTKFAMDNAAVGIFRIKPSGNIVYANRKAATLVGYRRSELLRMGIPDVVPGFSRENWPSFWEQIKQKKMVVTEGTVRRRDGTVFPTEVTAYYLFFKGTELVIGFFSDITERKRGEALREDVQRMIRHDLRSPTLAVQTIFSLFSRAENLTEDQRELLDSVMRSSRRMINIIDMSRALQRMESGTYVVNARPVDLVAQTRAVMDDLRPLLEQKKITVQILFSGFPIESTVDFLMQTEDILIYGLLGNLIKNAVEASPNGSTVTVDLGNPERQVVVSIHNEGVIPESIRESFFDKYVTVGKEFGTGLGTYTAKLITKTLGGTIEFMTSEKSGTVITVILPSDFESNS